MSYEYLFASLPVLPDRVGEKISFEPFDLYFKLRSEGGIIAEFADRSFRFFDIKNLEYIEQDLPMSIRGILSEDALIDSNSFPSWIRDAVVNFKSNSNEARNYSYLWEKYYNGMLLFAEGVACNFLSEWIPWEVGLMNAVAEHRAKRMNMEYATIDLHHVGRSEFKTVIELLSSLEEQGESAWHEMDMAVANARFIKAKELSPIYDFSINELAGYVARYKILKESEYL